MRNVLFVRRTRCLSPLVLAALHALHVDVLTVCTSERWAVHDVGYVGYVTFEVLTVPVRLLSVLSFPLSILSFWVQINSKHPVCILRIDRGRYSSRALRYRNITQESRLSSDREDLPNGPE